MLTTYSIKALRHFLYVAHCCCRGSVSQMTFFSPRTCARLALLRPRLLRVVCFFCVVGCFVERFEKKYIWQRKRSFLTLFFVSASHGGVFLLLFSFLIFFSYLLLFLITFFLTCAPRISAAFAPYGEEAFRDFGYYFLFLYLFFFVPARLSLLLLLLHAEAFRDFGLQSAALFYLLGHLL
jgi:hypothetical protein